MSLTGTFSNGRLGAVRLTGCNNVATTDANTVAQLSALNGKISKGNGATITEGQQNVMYGLEGTTLRAIKVTNDGTVETTGGGAGGGGVGNVGLSGTNLITSTSQQLLNYPYTKSTLTNSNLPLQSNDDGHLKVVVSEIETTSALPVSLAGTVSTTNATLDGCVTTNVLATSNTVLTKGDGIVAGSSGGLQQVLMYGKSATAPQNLQPLELTGDRLMVDVQELEVLYGRFTGTNSTQAPVIQMVGVTTDLQATSKFRTVKVSETGNLQVDIVGGGGGSGGSESYALTQYYSNGTIAMNTQTNLVTLTGVSVPEIKFFFDTETPFTNFYGIGSNDNTNWFVLYPENAQGATPIPAEANTATYPTTNGAEPYPRNFIQFVFKHPPKYIKFRNGSASQNNVQSHYIVTTH
jgi:hypothetical protein